MGVAASGEAAAAAAAAAAACVTQGADACGAHGRCNASSGLCECASGAAWGALREFALLNEQRLACEDDRAVVLGLAVFGLVANAAGLVLQCLMTSTMTQVRRTALTFFTYACGLAFAVLRIAVPLEEPLLGIDPLSSCLFALYTSGLFGIVLLFSYVWARARSRPPEPPHARILRKLTPPIATACAHWC